MQLVELQAQNFKSFGESVTVFPLNTALNIIVGENNVGKSNIIRVYNNLHDQLRGQGNLDTDFHNGIKDGPLILALKAVLDDTDMKYIMEKLAISTDIKEVLLKFFGKELEVRVERVRSNQSLLIRLGRMHVIGSHARLDKYPVVSGQPRLVSLQQMIERSGSIVGKFESMYEQEVANTSHQPTNLQLNQDLNAVIDALFAEKIILFPEFRFAPEKSVRRNDESQPQRRASQDGRELAYFLYGLKMGNLKKRNRWDQIRFDFHNIFSNLNLDVIERPELNIVRDGNVEINQQSISAGITEIINMLANLIGREGYVFIIDEPELHLHPHAKRLVSNLIKDSAKKNQILCVTHSTHFAYTESIEDITLVRNLNGSSILKRIKDDFFDTDEAKKILRITSPEQKEFLFARCVLLVEGPTELGAFPIFARKMKKDFDNRSISVISADSHYFAMFLKMLRGFGIPHIAVCDKDTLIDIDGTINFEANKVKASSIIKQLYDLGDLSESEKKLVKEIELVTERVQISGKERLRYKESVHAKLRDLMKTHADVHVFGTDFEGLFADAKYKQLTDDAERNFDKNKVLKGRYLAESITEIPQEIIDVIEDITSLEGK